MTKYSDAALSLRNVSISYDQKSVIKDFSYSITHGEKIAIMGSSGCGKSSLLNAIIGLTPISSGEIYINDTICKEGNIDSLRRAVAWLPQQIEPPIETARELFDMHMALKINSHLKFDNERVTSLLKMVNLNTEILDQKWTTLSGGERQRVLVISAIVLERGIILLDEPTSALDATSRAMLSKLLTSLGGRTIIAVTHDQELAKSFDRVIQL